MEQYSHEWQSINKARRFDAEDIKNMNWVQYWTREL